MQVDNNEPPKIDMPQEQTALLNEENCIDKLTWNKVMKVFMFTICAGFAGAVIGYGLTWNSTLPPAFIFVPISICTLVGSFYGIQKYVTNKFYCNNKKY